MTASTPIITHAVNGSAIATGWMPCAASVVRSHTFFEHLKSYCPPPRALSSVVMGIIFTCVVVLILTALTAIGYSVIRKTTAVKKGLPVICHQSGPNTVIKDTKTIENL